MTSRGCSISAPNTPLEEFFYQDVLVWAQGPKIRIIARQLWCLEQFFPEKLIAISVRATSGTTTREIDDLLAFVSYGQSPAINALQL